MTGDEIRSYLSNICDTYNLPILEQPLVAKVWGDSLRPYPHKTAMYALTQWIKATNYPPKVSDLVDLCRDAERTSPTRKPISLSVDTEKQKNAFEAPDDADIAWARFHAHWVAIGTNRALAGWTQRRELRKFPWDELIEGYRELAVKHPSLKTRCDDAIEMMRNGIKHKPTFTPATTPSPATHVPVMVGGDEIEF